MHQVAGRQGGESQPGRWLGAAGALSQSGKEQRCGDWKDRADTIS